MAKCENCGHDSDNPLEFKKITQHMNTYVYPNTGKVYGVLNSEEAEIIVKCVKYITKEAYNKLKENKPNPPALIRKDTGAPVVLTVSTNTTPTT